MTTEELRTAILRLVRPTEETGLSPAGIAVQLASGRRRRREAEVRESVRWLIERGYIEKFSPELAPAEARVRITAQGVDYLQSRDYDF